MLAVARQHGRQHLPRGCDGRAPDPLRVGGWSPMRMYRDDDPVDFVIIGTGAGGGTLACRLAEHGFSVVALDAGASSCRARERFASIRSDLAGIEGGASTRFFPITSSLRN